MSASPKTPNNEGQASFAFGLKPDEFDFSSYLNFDDLAVPPPVAPHPVVPNAGNALHSSAFSAYRHSDASSTDTPFSLFDEDIVPSETPALIADDDILTSPLWSQLALFPSASATSSAPVKTSTVSPSELSLPLVFEPTSTVPAVQAFTNTRKRPASPPLVPAPIGSPVQDETMAAPAPKKRRQASAVPNPSFTGTRHTVIPLLDESAPIQARNYSGPASKTSRRKIPAAAAKKVAALQAHGELRGKDVSNEIEQSIEEKRRQNTIAARRSRQRKAEHLSQLEETIQNLQEQLENQKREKDVWMRRAFDLGWTDAQAAPPML